MNSLRIHKSNDIQRIGVDGMNNTIVKDIYPTFVVQVNNDFLVYVPDWEIYTEGKSTFDAIEMARDAIGLKGIDYEDDGKIFPIPSDYENAKIKAKKNSDILDYSTGLLTMVDVDFVEYRRKNDYKVVKKNCTIPNWLNYEAEKANVNFSKVLQDALISKLNLSR